jgi:hypothetical protein
VSGVADRRNPSTGFGTYEINYIEYDREKPTTLWYTKIADQDKFHALACDLLSIFDIF